MVLPLMKNHHLRHWDSPSLLNWIRTLTLLILVKLPLRKLEPSMKVLLSEVALYKSTTRLRMEFCYHFWADAPS